ncbi:hypothetical protein BN946_scf185007.g24 [Trametes cinnabarina]|uniref:Uncharacterized protein n=1 Tax=Pycnoporus cinnabarinus TaxID=5643 RepID=A0A060SF13_PYCCI|nr:hypothetical protein BN946_scf185007.g24 [Trametes cinnabarina]
MTPNLPVELYIQILHELPGRHPYTFFTLLSFLSVNHATRAAALDNTVWEKLYKSRYTHSDESREADRQQRCAGDFHAMFFERHKLDRTALRLLDYIRTVHGNYREGLSIASQIVQEMSFDVWDALELEAQLPVPKVFRDPTLEDLEEEAAPHALPRRFWAKSLQGAIGRTYALRTWQHLREGGATFDDVLAGFDAFMDRSPKEKPDYNLSTVAKAVHQFMRSEGFAVARSDQTFMNPLNQFPHRFLGAGRSATLPMSLVWVFSGICRRLGLRAEPTNTPGTVFCHITSQDPQHGDILYDVCGTWRPVVFTSQDVQARIAEAGMSSSYSRDAVFPADLAVILRRAALNIINVSGATATFLAPSVSIDMDIQTRTEYAASVAMAAIVAPPMFGRGRPRMSLALPHVPEQCPLDRWPVLADTLVHPAEAEEVRGQHVSGQPPKRRPEGMPSGFVGQVVHTENGEVGCVYVWENRSEEGASEPYIVFYVLAKSGTITYHPNDFKRTKPARLTAEIAHRLRRSLLCFDRYFEDVIIPREDGIGGRFVPSVELQTAHPDDLDYGAQWTEEQLEGSEAIPAVSTWSQPPVTAESWVTDLPCPPSP